LLCHLPASATERLVQADSGLLQPREPELGKAPRRIVFYAPAVVLVAAARLGGGKVGDLPAACVVTGNAN
jgi:hypothetical protein